MKYIINCLACILLVLIVGCSKDNKDAPDATINGKVVFENQPLGLRSNGVQLELWQPGYQLFSKIPVHINQDGTFSAQVFDGSYRLTMLRGSGPWADKTDSIVVDVKGSASIDFPVDPYFVIKNANFVKAGNNINATFNLQRVNTSKNLELVRIYVGQTIITDQTNNAGSAQKAAAVITDLTQPVTLSVPIPASLSAKDYVFVRVGVKTAGVAELLYSMPVKIMVQ